MGLHEVKDKPIPRCKPATSQVIDLVIAFFLLLPEGEVLLEKLDDAFGIAEVVLLKLVDLVESRLESGVSQLAGLGMILEHLIVEDTEVQGESQFDWVARGQIDGICLLIRGLGLLLDVLEQGFLGILGDVAVVVANHLHEEGLGFVSAFPGKDTVVDDVDDLLAI